MSVRSAYCDICEAQRAFEKPEASGAVGCLVLMLFIVLAIVLGSVGGPLLAGGLIAFGVLLLVLLAVRSAFSRHRCRTCGTAKFFWM